MGDGASSCAPALRNKKSNPLEKPDWLTRKSGNRTDAYVYNLYFKVGL